VPVDLQQARAFLDDRERRRQRDLEQRFDRARADARAIVDLIVRKYRPRRVYQWGSVLDRSRFSEISDIDVAIEGITDPATLSALLDEADRLTDLPSTSWRSNGSNRSLPT
jgi:predicted nucleotidyltransferase